MSTRLKHIAKLEFTLGHFESGSLYLSKAKLIDETQNNNRGLVQGYLIESNIYMGHYSALELFNDEFALKQAKKAVGMAERTKDQGLLMKSCMQVAEIYKMRGDMEIFARINDRIENIRANLTPRKIVLCVCDTSGSMQGKREQALREGLMKLYNDGINLQDDFGIITFHDVVEQPLPITTKSLAQPKNLQKRDKILDIIKNIKATQYKTALYDAMALAIEKLDIIQENTRKIVYIFTDGADNVSQKYYIPMPTSRKNFNLPNKKSIDLLQFLQDTLMDVEINIIGIDTQEEGTNQIFEYFVKAIRKGKVIQIQDGGTISSNMATFFDKIVQDITQLEVAGLKPEVEI
jgi:hypothetical protein